VNEAADGDGALSPLQRKLRQMLQVDAATHIDTLIGQLEGNSTSEVIAALCELEMADQIRQLPGKNYVRVW
jgi:predicted Rossmann fold nucleotide-binding protein DprA/Smf involved in DNA uptake